MDYSMVQNSDPYLAGFSEHPDSDDNSSHHGKKSKKKKKKNEKDGEHHKHKKSKHKKERRSSGKYESNGSAGGERRPSSGSRKNSLSDAMQSITIPGRNMSQLLPHHYSPTTLWPVTAAPGGGYQIVQSNTSSPINLSGVSGNIEGTFKYLGNNSPLATPLALGVNPLLQNVHIANSPSPLSPASYVQLRPIGSITGTIAGATSYVAANTMSSSLQRSVFNASQINNVNLLTPRDLVQTSTGTSKTTMIHPPGVDVPLDSPTAQESNRPEYFTNREDKKATLNLDKNKQLSGQSIAEFKSSVKKIPDRGFGISPIGTPTGEQKNVFDSHSEPVKSYPTNSTTDEECRYTETNSEKNDGKRKSENVSMKTSYSEDTAESHKSGKGHQHHVKNDQFHGSFDRNIYNDHGKDDILSSGQFQNQYTSSKTNPDFARYQDMPPSANQQGSQNMLRPHDHMRFPSSDHTQHNSDHMRGSQSLHTRGLLPDQARGAFPDQTRGIPNHMRMRGPPPDQLRYLPPDHLRRPPPNQMRGPPLTQIRGPTNDHMRYQPPLQMSGPPPRHVRILPPDFRASPPQQFPATAMQVPPPVHPDAMRGPPPSSFQRLPKTFNCPPQDMRFPPPNFNPPPMNQGPQTAITNKYSGPPNYHQPPPGFTGHPPNSMSLQHISQPTSNFNNAPNYPIQPGLQPAPIVFHQNIADKFSNNPPDFSKPPPRFYESNSPHSSVVSSNPQQNNMTQNSLQDPAQHDNIYYSKHEQEDRYRHTINFENPPHSEHSHSQTNQVVSSANTLGSADYTKIVQALETLKSGDKKGKNFAPYNTLETEPISPPSELKNAEKEEKKRKKEKKHKKKKKKEKAEQDVNEEDLEKRLKERLAELAKLDKDGNQASGLLSIQLKPQPSKFNLKIESPVMKGNVFQKYKAAQLFRQDSPLFPGKSSDHSDRKYRKVAESGKEEICENDMNERGENQTDNDDEIKTKEDLLRILGLSQPPTAKDALRKKGEPTAVHSGSEDGEVLSDDELEERRKIREIIQQAKEEALTSSSPLISIVASEQTAGIEHSGGDQHKEPVSSDGEISSDGEVSDDSLDEFGRSKKLRTAVSDMEDNDDIYRQKGYSSGSDSSDNSDEEKMRRWARSRPPSRNSKSPASYRSRSVSASPERTSLINETSIPEVPTMIGKTHEDITNDEEQEKQILIEEEKETLEQERLRLEVQQLEGTINTDLIIKQDPEKAIAESSGSDISDEEGEPGKINIVGADLHVEDVPMVTTPLDNKTAPAFVEKEDLKRIIMEKLYEKQMENKDTAASGIAVDGDGKNEVSYIDIFADSGDENKVQENESARSQQDHGSIESSSAGEKISGVKVDESIAENDENIGPVVDVKGDEKIQKHEVTLETLSEIRNRMDQMSKEELEEALQKLPSLKEESDVMQDGRTTPVHLRDIEVTLKSLTEYLHEKRGLYKQCFRNVNKKEFKHMLPKYLRKFELKTVRNWCLDEIEIMSKKRLRSILLQQTLASSSSEDSDDETAKKAINEKKEETKTLNEKGGPTPSNSELMTSENNNKEITEEKKKKKVTIKNKKTKKEKSKKEEVTETSKASNEQGDEVMDTSKASNEQGDEVMDTIKGLNEQGDEVMETSKGLNEQGDEEMETSKGLNEQGDEVTETSKGLSEQGDEVTETRKASNEQGDEVMETRKGSNEQGEKSEETVSEGQQEQSINSVTSVMELEGKDENESKVATDNKERIKLEPTSCKEHTEESEMIAVTKEPIDHILNDASKEASYQQQQILSDLETSEKIEKSADEEERLSLKTEVELQTCNEDKEPKEGDACTKSEQESVDSKDSSSASSSNEEEATTTRQSDSDTDDDPEDDETKQASSSSESDGLENISSLDENDLHKTSDEDECDGAGNKSSNYVGSVNADDAEEEEEEESAEEGSSESADDESTDNEDRDLVKGRDSKRDNKRKIDRKTEKRSKSSSSDASSESNDEKTSREVQKSKEHRVRRQRNVESADSKRHDRHSKADQSNSRDHYNNEKTRRRDEKAKERIRHERLEHQNTDESSEEETDDDKDSEAERRKQKIKRYYLAKERRKRALEKPEKENQYDIDSKIKKDASSSSSSGGSSGSEEEDDQASGKDSSSTSPGGGDDDEDEYRKQMKKVSSSGKRKVSSEERREFMKYLAIKRKREQEKKDKEAQQKADLAKARTLQLMNRPPGSQNKQKPAGYEERKRQRDLEKRRAMQNVPTSEARRSLDGSRTQRQRSLTESKYDYNNRGRRRSQSLSDPGKRSRESSETKPSRDNSANRRTRESSKRKQNTRSNSRDSNRRETKRKRRRNSSSGSSKKEPSNLRELEFRARALQSLLSRKEEGNRRIEPSKKHSRRSDR